MNLSSFFKVKTRIGTAVGFVLLIGCASTVPVQEMSNARQAVRAAEDVEAARYAPDSMARARRLLDDAAGYLEKGNYGLARDNALEARHVAYKARKQALSEQQGDLGW